MMKKRLLILIIFLQPIIQLSATVWLDEFKAINQEILSIERTKCSQESILSKLHFIRDKAILSGRYWMDSNDTLFITEKVCNKDLQIDFWKGSNFTKEFWSVSNSRDPNDSVIFIEHFYNNNEFYCRGPSEQKRFLMCTKRDIDALNAESQNAKEKIRNGELLTEGNPTLFTFSIRIIFNENKRYSIDIIHFDGYDGF